MLKRTSGLGQEAACALARWIRLESGSLYRSAPLLKTPSKMASKVQKPLLQTFQLIRRARQWWPLQPLREGTHDDHCVECFNQFKAMLRMPPVRPRGNLSRQFISSGSDGGVQRLTLQRSKFDSFCFSIFRGIYFDD